MNSSYQIVATPVFRFTLERLCFFLERKFDSKAAQRAKRSIKESIQANLSSNPHSAPISERLAELGLTDYRQYLVDGHNLVFFRIDEQRKKVILIAAMDSRQSIKKLLYDVNIRV